MTAREPLLWPREAAPLFGVTPKVLTAWARKGKLPYASTIGGQHRFPESAVVKALADLGHPDPKAAVAEVLRRRRRART